MLRAARRQRTIARSAEVRGVGFFHGADVTIRFHPADPDTGIVFRRCDLPGRPMIPARIESVTPSQRRTTISRDGAGRGDDRACHGRAGGPPDRQLRSSRSTPANAPAATARAGRSSRPSTAPASSSTTGCARPWSSIDSVTVREGDAVLAAHPPAPAGGLVLSYHLDYGREAPIRAQSFFVDLSPETFRDELATSRTFLLEAEANALRAAGIGVRTTAADLLLFGRDGVIGNELRYPDECVRHKILDMVGDLALLDSDLHGLRRRAPVGPPAQRRACCGS